MAKHTDGQEGKGIDEGQEGRGFREFTVILQVKAGEEFFRLPAAVQLSLDEAADALTAVAHGKSLDSILAAKWAADQGGKLQKIEGGWISSGARDSSSPTRSRARGNSGEHPGKKYESKFDRDELLRYDFDKAPDAAREKQRGIPAKERQQYLAAASAQELKIGEDGVVVR